MALAGQCSALGHQTASARVAMVLAGPITLMSTSLLPTATAMPTRAQTQDQINDDWTSDVQDIPDPPFKDLLDASKVETKETGRAIWERFKKQVVGSRTTRVG